MKLISSLNTPSSLYIYISYLLFYLQHAIKKTLLFVRQTDFTIFFLVLALLSPLQKKKSLGYMRPLFLSHSICSLTIFVSIKPNTHKRKLYNLFIYVIKKCLTSHKSVFSSGNQPLS